MSFSDKILSWYKIHQRDLPWRNTSDPYRIYLSEIILQQTRINQGIDYYYKFVENFPDVESLANASEDEIMSLWQGLGYYSRARNLHATAKIIVNNYNGKFPESFDELLKLKGVGRYTAAAIASIAFNIPVAVVDGNVIRLISRFFGIQEPVDKNAVKKQIEKVADEMIDPAYPAFFNQAMMEVGAMVCKPLNPDCDRCPLSDECYARINNLQAVIPKKEKQVKIKKRYFHYLFTYYRDKGEVFLLSEKRTGKDIWQNLYQLPLIESASIYLPHSHDVYQYFKERIEGFRVNIPVVHLTHLLTHQKIFSWFYAVESPQFDVQNTQYQWVSLDEFRKMGKPVLITRFLDSFFKD